MARHASPFGRQQARHAPASPDLRDRREQHSLYARAARPSQLRRNQVHSGDFKDAKKWKGRKALVLGTGTSGHDVAQELHAHGADVTIIQRSKTYVVSLKEARASTPSIPKASRLRIAICWRLVSLSRPAAFLPAVNGQRPRGGRGAAGAPGKEWLPPAFRRGRHRLPDDVSAPGGGYYFNVGCSELIISGAIKLLQFADIERFVAEGARLRDGRIVPAELLVWRPATRTSRNRSPLSRRRNRRACRTGLGSTRAENCATCGGAPHDPASRHRRKRAMPDSRYLALQIKALGLGMVA